MAYGWVFDDGSDGDTSDRESPKLLGKGEGRLVLKSDVATRSISMEVGTRRWSVGGCWVYVATSRSGLTGWHDRGG